MNNGQEVELQRLQQAVTEAEEALNCLLKIGSQPSIVPRYNTTHPTTRK